MDVAERHRLSIDRWFYPCSPKMHYGLADMWEADRRFADNIDKYGAGPHGVPRGRRAREREHALRRRFARLSCRNTGGRTRVAVRKCGFGGSE